MAYENGRKINRYANKTKGKRIQKNRQSSKQRCWNGCGDYWNAVYLSGSRTYAKRETNRLIRRTVGNIPSNAGYRKMFDYDWAIW